MNITVNVIILFTVSITTSITIVMISMTIISHANIITSKTGMIMIMRIIRIIISSITALVTLITGIIVVIPTAFLNLKLSIFNPSFNVRCCYCHITTTIAALLSPLLLHTVLLFLLLHLLLPLLLVLPLPPASATVVRMMMAKIMMAMMTMKRFTTFSLLLRLLWNSLLFVVRRLCMPIPINTTYASLCTHTQGACIGKAPANDGCSCCGGYEFQAIILLKLLVMDVPQQVPWQSCCAEILCAVVWPGFCC